MNKIKQVFSKKPTNEHDLNRICSTQYGDDGVALIGQNLVEFAKLASNFNCRLVTGGIYGCSVYIESVAELALVDKRDRSAEAMTAIHQLIRKKREENCKRDRMTNKQIVETLKKTDYKLISLNRLSTIETQLTNLQQRINSIKIKTVSTELSQKTFACDPFPASKYLENAKSSPEFMEKLCVQLSEELDSDNNDSDDDSDNEICFPPFEDIETMEEKKKNLMKYFNYLQTNSDGSLNPTDLQTKISQWLRKLPKSSNRFPNGENLQRLKNEFQQKFQLENTFGTVHICADMADDDDEIEIFVVVDGLLIWNYCTDSIDMVLTSIYEKFKQYWPENGRLATKLDVPEELAHVFVNTNNKDVYVSNNEAFQWAFDIVCITRYLIKRMKELYICSKIGVLYNGFVQEPDVFDEWFHLFKHMKV